MADSQNPPAAQSQGGDPIFKQYLLDEFVEEYQEGRMSRRDALLRIIGITGSVPVATAILAACAPAATPAPTAAPAPTMAPTVHPPLHLCHYAPTVPPTTAPTMAPTVPASAVPTSPMTADHPCDHHADGECPDDGHYRADRGACGHHRCGRSVSPRYSGRRRLNHRSCDGRIPQRLGQGDGVHGASKTAGTYPIVLIATKTAD